MKYSLYTIETRVSWWVEREEKEEKILDLEETNCYQNSFPYTKTKTLQNPVPYNFQSSDGYGKLLEFN